jgi:hypothetical protein
VLDVSLLGKARQSGLIEVGVHDLRDFTHDRHRTVDDTPYGGGAGMVMRPEPWGEALDAVLPDDAVLIVPSPAGERFTQAAARELALEPRIVFACGRYEGIDQRVLDLAYRIPGSVRMPDGLARKQILRQAFPDLLRPELLAQPKRGFWLPIRRWMIGPLRPLCEEALGHVKSIETFRPEAIDEVWDRFCLHPDSQVWSSAFMLCVLGCYMRQIRSIVPKATQSSAPTIDLAPMPVHTR